MASYTIKVFDDGSILHSQPAIEPEYGIVLHCSQTTVTTTPSHPEGYQRYMNWRGGANDNPITAIGRGLPSCFKYHFQNEKYLFLDEARERWWFELLRQSLQWGRADTVLDSEVRVAWDNLVQPDKAFTNVKGDFYGLGYIIKSPDHPGKLRLEPIICTGATIKLIGKKYLKGDGFYYQNFEVIDILTDEYKTVTLDKFWLVQPATNSVNVDTVNKEKIDPFPKMAGNRMTPHFLWGMGTKIGTIRADWIKPLTYKVTKPAYPYMPFQTVADTDRFDLRNL